MESETVMTTVHVPQGWQCPLCRRIYAPSVRTCAEHKPVRTDQSLSGEVTILAHLKDVNRVRP